MEIEEAKRVFRENLKRLRVEQGWEMADVAKRAGISVRMYRKLEDGQTVPRLLTLIRLLRAFEVVPSELLRGI